MKYLQYLTRKQKEEENAKTKEQTAQADTLFLMTVLLCECETNNKAYKIGRNKQIIGGGLCPVCGVFKGCNNNHNKIKGKRPAKKPKYKNKRG